MNQKLFSGLTASLLISTIGTPLVGNAKPLIAEDQGHEATLKTAYNPSSMPAVNLSQEVVKVGEKPSQTSTNGDSSIARVHSHELSGRQAATLYVRNIPILTFLGSKANSEKPTSEIKVGSQQPGTGSTIASITTLTNFNSSQLTAKVLPDASPTGTQTSAAPSPTDPLWKATEVAAKLNQLVQEGVDAKAITVRLSNGGKGQYIIQANDKILAILDRNTVLPDTTKSLEQDALQATNRLRRVLGNAAPLSSVSGIPGRGNGDISLGSVKFSVKGMASWYGPGFQGNMVASGERFNPNALTAAHRTLPFGTQVRVVNLDNGVSVVVRINDRGPFHGNRIIDVSTAAARVLGLVQSGVAPVRLEVLAPATVTAER
jgi:rare lipoprotein A